MAEDASILLAEDEQNDVILLRRAFQKAGIRQQLYAVHDGVEAIDYLAGEGIYEDRVRYPLPCLLVTDIKMPRADGFELVAWLQTRSELRGVPKIVISSSCLEYDLARCIMLGASAFFVKPADPDELVEIVRNWHDVWIAPHYCERGRTGEEPNPAP